MFQRNAVEAGGVGTKLRQRVAIIRLRINLLAFVAEICITCTCPNLVGQGTSPTSIPIAVFQTNAFSSNTIRVIVRDA
jgi:hypothetical protein